LYLDDTDAGKANEIGAGWGGATVSLVPEPLVPKFIKALHSGYYQPRYPNLTQDELSDACFATKPEAGACIMAVSSLNT
jgi:galactokinase